MPDLVVSINGAPVEILFGNSELARFYMTEAKDARDTTLAYANQPFGEAIPGEPSGNRSALHFSEQSRRHSEQSQNAAGFALRSQLLNATDMVGGDVSQVFDDAGTHSAIAGEVGADGNAATVGASIPNKGRYVYQASPAAWLRSGNLDSQAAAAVVGAAVDEAVAEADTLLDAAVATATGNAETLLNAAVATATADAEAAATAADASADAAAASATAADTSADSAALSAAGLATVLVSDPLDPRQRVDFTDIEGNIFYTVEEGDPTPGELNAATQAAQDGIGVDPLDAPSVEIVDDEDNLIARFMPDTIKHPKIDAIDVELNEAKIRAWAAQVKVAGPAETDHQFRTTVSHILKYGQSNSNNTSDSMGLPDYPPPLFMFNGGVNTRRDADFPTDTTAITGSQRTSFVAMQEQDSETGMACALTTMLDLAKAWGADLSGSNMKLLGSAAGVGGVSIETLRSTYFFRIEEDIAEAKAIADAANESYSVAALLYNGNESNQLNTAPVGGSATGTTIANYLAQLRQMQVDVQTEAQATSGQDWPVPMFLVQTNSHLSTASGNYYNVNALVAQAQVKAGQNLDEVNDNIIFCGPSYQFRLDNAPNTVHFSMIGGAVRDALLGVAMFKLFFLGVKQQPLVPTVTVFGDYYRLKFPIDPGRSLEWDTTTVPAQTNYGFRAFDSGGNPRTIGTPRIIARDTVEIYGDGAVSGDLIHYADTTTTGGTLGLGNLRDNQGDDIVTARFGTRVDNWIPLFKEIAS